MTRRGEEKAGAELGEVVVVVSVALGRHYLPSLQPDMPGCRKISEQLSEAAANGDSDVMLLVSVLWR